jgi:voltage-dependent potassium channel beta subunit
MEYRRLGKSGLKVSALSFGSWVTFGTQVNESAAVDLMKYAYDQGVNFFDNAEVYAQGQSEVLMGKALKKLELGRDTYSVSSKVFWGGEKPTQLGLSRKHVFDACHAALRRLQVEYLDLYFCHRPDIETPIEETVQAMSDLVRQGKVMYWGTSEWSAQQITEAYGIAKSQNLIAPTMEQPEYNMFHRQKVESDFRPLYENNGLGTTIWSPLASGVLTGKYNHGIPSDSRMNQPGYEWLRAQLESAEGRSRIEKVKKLEPVAKQLGCNLSQLALAWCLRKPFVSTVILGASRKSQLEENLKALPVVSKINHSVEEQIESILGNQPESPETFK